VSVVREVEVADHVGQVVIQDLPLIAVVSVCDQRDADVWMQTQRVSDTNLTRLRARGRDEGTGDIAQEVTDDLLHLGPHLIQIVVHGARRVEAGTEERAG
jgi:hypothetical protein